MTTRPNSNTNVPIEQFDDVGSWIKAARINRGLTRRELSCALGKLPHNTSIYHWEKNSYKPNPIDCTLLAAFFDVPLDAFLALRETTKTSRCRPPKQRNVYQMKTIVASSPIGKPAAGCHACLYQQECRDAVNNSLPCPCETLDLHDLYVAQRTGQADVLLARYQLGESNA